MDQAQQIVAVVDLGTFEADQRWPLESRFLVRQLGRQTLLQRVVRRLSEALELCRIVVAGANIPGTLLTRGTAGAEVLDIAHSHPCERLAAAADRWQADWVMHVAANRPFVDPVLIDRLAAQARMADECDYFGYYSPEGGWQRMNDLGLAGELCHADSLRRLRRHAAQLPETDSPPTVADWFQSAPGSYQMRSIPVPPALDRGDLRFSLEDEEDWENAEILAEALGRDATEWQLLTELLQDQYGLRRSMEYRNQTARSSIAVRFT